MEISILGGAGLHASELKAVKKMESEFRSSWYGYAGLVVTDDQGSMEIDTLIITHDRLLLVELKEWNGTLEANSGKWYLNGRSRGSSPYYIKRQHARRLVSLLKSELEHKLGYFLNVEAHVVLCGNATADLLPQQEKTYVHSLEEFMEISSTEGYERLTQDGHVN